MNSCKELTWLTVHLNPPDGIESRPLTSSTALSNSEMPLPLMAHVGTSFMKELVAISNCRIEVHGTQSILLTTRITGVAEAADFCSEEENNSYFLKFSIS